jgi:putative ABC transport system permease protein
MGGFLFDLRQVIRGLVRTPGFAALAIFGLAIGTGGSTAMFSIVDTVLVRRLPYTAADRQVLFFATDANAQRVPLGGAEIFALQRKATTAEAVAAFHPNSVMVSAASGPHLVRAVNASASVFSDLGIVPVRGRAFEPGEDLEKGQKVVIVSDAFWRRELNASPTVIGTTLRVDHELLTVVGVLGPGVEMPRRSAAAAEVLLPLAVPPELASQPGTRAGLYGVARLKAGVSLASARAEFDSIVRGMSGYGIVIDPMQDSLVGEAAPALRAAFAGVLLLLFISCANVTLLLLLRATVRGRETLPSGRRSAEASGGLQSSRSPRGCSFRSPAARWASRSRRWPSNPSSRSRPPGFHG